MLDRLSGRDGNAFPPRQVVGRQALRLQQPPEVALVHDAAAFAPGAGPRHLAFAPDGKTIYVANELDSTVTSFANISGIWKTVKTASTRPKTPVAKKNFPGAIKISSCGKYFFVTNRGDDTIAMFKTFADGDFELLDNIPAQGIYPSDIKLNGDDSILWCINLKNGTAARFKLNKAAGTLEAIPGTVSVPRGIGLCD